MQINSLAIATITWARDESEEQLLRLALTQLASFNIPVFVCDGGSPQHFIAFLQGFPHFHLLPSQHRGLWGQVNSSLKAAADSGATAILYTEPDKHLFFTYFLSSFLDRASFTPATGIVLAERSAAAFATFPAFQQTTETSINFCCSEIVQHSLDYTYGPFVLNSSLVHRLEGLKSEIGWGWRPYAFCIAARLNMQIATVKGDYECPPDQRTDDARERVYRMRQLAENIDAIVLAATAKID